MRKLKRVLDYNKAGSRQVALSPEIKNMFNRIVWITAFAVVSALAQEQAAPAPAAGGGGGGGGAAGNAGGGGGGGGGDITAPGGGGLGGNTRGNVPTNPNSLPGNTPNQFPEMQRPIFISGKVMLEDGTPPPESVTIERVCGGIARPEGYTDSKGRFSFEVGKNQAMFSDASYGNDRDPFSSAPGFGNTNANQNSRGMSGMGRQQMERELMGCDITAKLAGFRAEAISLAGRRSRNGTGPLRV